MILLTAYGQGKSSYFRLDAKVESRAGASLGTAGTKFSALEDHYITFLYHKICYYVYNIKLDSKT